jgi:hemerythrin-like domain-containing protein
LGSPEPARRAPRTLLDPPAGFDDPLEMLLGCHRRIEKQLETLKRLRAHLQSKGIDAEASTAAEAVLRYFRKAAVDHHEDEEQDVFPLLEQRIDDAAQKARFRELRARLEAEHRKLEEAWARVRKPLEGIAEGLMRSLAEADVAALAEAYQAHIRIEEETLRELFRFLDARDLEALGRSMAARRKVPFPPA